MVIDLKRFAAHAVWCPRCYSDPGSGCRDVRTGRPMGGYHFKRWDELNYQRRRAA